MNKVILIGRIVKDIDVQYTKSNKAYTKFSLAVNREFKNDKGEYEADFINCIAWDKTAETLEKYTSKGQQIAIEGRISVDKTTDEKGNNRYYTNVIITHFEFISYAKKEEHNTDVIVKEEKDPFAEFGEQIELSPDDLPF